MKKHQIPKSDTAKTCFANSHALANPEHFMDCGVKGIMFLPRIVLALSLLAPAIYAEAAYRSVASKKDSARAIPAAAGEDWPMWGGKNRDFLANSSGLADAWPASGPRKIWSRPLGDGYSAIAEEGGVLYTAFRRGSKDVITALDAATGKTRWEYEYENPFTNAFVEKVGPGPYAMPEVVGDRVVTASGTGKIHSLDKKTGRPVWSHDLYSEFNGTPLQYGYSCHGLPYKDTVIYLAGGRGSVAGAVLGTLIFGVLRNALPQIPGATFYDRLIVGLVVIVIVVMDQLLLRRRT